MTPIDFLQAIGLRDIVDLLLLWAMFYALLRLVKGTVAVPVLIIVAGIAATGWAARAMHLMGSAEVITKFLQYSIFILIIVFHQELRRILVRIGQRLLPHADYGARADALSEVAVACERLAKARVGALFVFEGELDVLERCGDSGRPVDAPLRCDTLVALSIPHAANLAHDGAIVIQNLEISRAGVICPLSKQDLDPRFGTRHRGAVGISEETDALVVVISEERGECRVVERGEVSEALDGAGVQARLNLWLHRSPDEDAPETLDGSESLTGSRPHLRTGSHPSTASSSSLSRKRPPDRSNTHSSPESRSEASP